MNQRADFFATDKCNLSCSFCRISAFGPGLQSGQNECECRFTVKGTNHGEGLGFAIEGPCRPAIATDNTKDGSIDVTYTPKLPGDYKISIYYYGKHLNGSPFKVKITGEVPHATVPEAVSKVKVFGKALELGRPGVMNEVYIDCRETNIAGPDLAVSMKNPPRASSMIKLHDQQDGTYIVTYKPTIPGMYTLNVKVEEHHVPGSPFTIKVSRF